MSSRPTPDKVEQLVDRLDYIDRLDVQIGHLRPKVEELKHAEEERLKACRDVVQLLRAMDADNTHNTGWEARAAELVRMAMRIARRET